MPRRDLVSSVDVRHVAHASPSDNTAVVGAIIDSQGFDALAYLIHTGTLADVDATFEVLIEHGDAANLSDAATVPADQLIEESGVTAEAGGGDFTFAFDNSVRKIGYIGAKRYTRMTITPAANSGAAPIAVVAMLGHPHVAPV